MTTFFDLPPEIIMTIYSKLEIPDLLKQRLVSNENCNLATEMIAKEKIEKYEIIIISYLRRKLTHLFGCRNLENNNNNNNTNEEFEKLKTEIEGDVEVFFSYFLDKVSELTDTLELVAQNKKTIIKYLKYAEDITTLVYDVNLKLPADIKIRPSIIDSVFNLNYHKKFEYENISPRFRFNYWKIDCEFFGIQLDQATWEDAIIDDLILNRSEANYQELVKAEHIASISFEDVPFFDSDQEIMASYIMARHQSIQLEKQLIAMENENKNLSAKLKDLEEQLRERDEVGVSKKRKLSDTPEILEIQEGIDNNTFQFGKI